MPILPKLNLKAAVKLAPITLAEPEVQLSQPTEQSSTSELPIIITDDNSVNPSVNCPASQSQSSSNYIVSSRYHSSYGTSNYEVDADEVDDHDDIENNPDDYFHDDDDNDIEQHNFKEPQSLKRDYSQFSNNNNDDDSFNDIHSTHIDRYSDVADDPDNQISLDGQPPQPISSPPYPLYHGVGSLSAPDHPDLITSTSRHSLSDSCSSDQSTNLHPISTIANESRLLLESQFAQPLSTAMVVAHSKKRRRTVNKLESDPEKLPLCDLLFYNPPETIFQKENKTQNEPITAGDENQPQPASLANRRTSSRANSLTNERSTKSKTPELQLQQDSNNNIENELLTEKGPILVDDHCDQENILAKDDESSDTRLLVTAGSEKDPIEEEVDGDNNDDDNEEPLALTIDENGEIVLKNPNSLNESGKNGSKKPKPKMKSSTTYNSFRRRERSKNIWNTEETGNFYTALEIVGTDFSLMEAVFFKDRNRDRKQLKQKFKREEKINRAYIDEILYKSLRNRTKLSEYLLKGSSSEANAADIATTNAANAVAAASAANLTTTTTPLVPLESISSISLL